MNTNTPSTLFRGPEPVEDRGVFTDAETYYSNKTRHSHGLRRTYSQNGLMRQFERLGLKAPYRRGSHDVATTPGERRFLIHVDATLQRLQSQEDTDDNCQITIDDNGPKVLTLRTADSAGHNAGDIRGTYALSNLLQELTLAKDYGRTEIILDEARLVENPVSRLSRLIRDHFWAGLTRRLDESSVEVASRDDKDWTDKPQPRIYVPKSLPDQLEYYRRVARDRPELDLDVCELPAEITGEYVRDLNTKPGVLALAMEKSRDPATGGERLRGVPFVVPGGRFNEMYGWDSYFETLGLLVNDKVELAKGMVRNFCFCIQHYGKILNATRSYYLGRSQPPFLTDMALRVYDKIRHEPGAKDFLRHAMLAAVKEYHGVWMASPRYDAKTGLSRYGSVGVGVPPEVERGHFDVVLRPYAEKHGMTVDEFADAYTYGRVTEPELDAYFAHDRAVRESGHDTTYRLDGGCADIATIDLNALLFKVEVDIARAIPNLLGGQLIMTAEFAAGTPFAAGDRVSAARFDRAAKRRKMAMDKYLWDEDKGMFFDYDTAKGERRTFETATTFWTLWAGAASAGQAAAMVIKALPRLEAYGGLVSTTLDSRGELGPERPARQWDFPYGWAPQQMLAWTGLLRYGHEEEAERLAYKWLFMMTKAFVDFNGVVAEKYDVTRPIDPHRVDVEYGNVGLGFRGVVREGFGWVNASYVYGLQIVNGRMRLALGALTPYETYIKAVDAWKEKEMSEMV